MTQRLYYDDAYCTVFDATVVAVEDAGRRVYLDRTAFYPTSGGQPNDVGSLGNHAVLDVIDEGTRVAHLMDSPLSVGPVSGRVDWERRFDHMQQHTGQHLLSALFADLLGHDTASVHFGSALSTLDLAAADLAPEQLREVERHANRLVAEDRPIEIGYETAETAIGLRKASDRTGTLRIVTIAGVDRSACGGTHVRRTGEIGVILLRRAERAKAGTRVEFVCGMRAVQRARADYDLLASGGGHPSPAVDEVGSLVPALAEQARSAESANRRLTEELAAYRARELHAQSTPDTAGVRWIVQRSPTGRAEDARPLALAIAALPRVVFLAVRDETHSVLMSASDDAGVNAGAALKAALAELSGKGGGSPRLAQGSLPDDTGLEILPAALGFRA